VAYLILVMRNKPFLRIEPVSLDDQLLEVRVTADNGSFGGNARIYTTYNALREFGKTLQGFPHSRCDKKIFDHAKGLGYCFFNLRLYCHDSGGHVWAAVYLQDQYHRKDTVQLEFEVEPAAIDRFQSALLDMCRAESGMVELEGLIE